ncbi:MAG TPA: hypothetical protein VIV57_24520 [Anaeromyxobacter sp.]
MFRRILSCAVFAASLAAAAPALADDPVGPSPDDPSYTTWVNERGPARVFARSAPSADDPSARAWSIEPAAKAKEAECPCVASCASKAHGHEPGAPAKGS